MSKTERQIADAVRAERFAISSHAADRLLERDVEIWQIIDGFDRGETVSIDPKAMPNPKILRRQLLADGIEIVAVWSYDRAARVAKLVTIYFED